MLIICKLIYYNVQLFILISLVQLYLFTHIQAPP